MKRVEERESQATEMRPAEEDETVAARSEAVVILSGAGVVARVSVLISSVI
jgi:hypothetical protein